MQATYVLIRNNQTNFKMKFLIVAALIASAMAAGPDHDATVLRADSNVDVAGYQYGYETSNQIKADEQGVLKNVGSDNEALEVTGQFSYTAPDGTPVKVSYRADENGFQPDNLPQGPAIPELIARAIKLLPVVENQRKK